MELFLQNKLLSDSGIFNILYHRLRPSLLVLVALLSTLNPGSKLKPIKLLLHNTKGPTGALTSPVRTESGKRWGQVKPSQEQRKAPAEV